MKKILFTLSMLLVLLLAVGASADTLTFDLGTPNSAISGFPGPYVEVTINRTDSTHATFTFTSLTNSGNIYLMGDGSTAALNVNATSFTVGAISGSNSGTGFLAPSFSSTIAAGQEVDGFGKFNFTIDDFDGFSRSVSTLSFTLTDTSGTWASASDVLTANAGGSTAAAHIFVTSSPAKRSNGAIATGFAANGAQVPEPATMLIFGSGLIGLAGVIRKRFKK